MMLAAAMGPEPYLILGALVTGLLAGVIALWMSGWNVPRWLAGLMPVVIIPLVATTIVGLVMYLFLGKPLAAVTTALQEGLSNMSGGSMMWSSTLIKIMSFISMAELLSSFPIL